MTPRNNADDPEVLKSIDRTLRGQGDESESKMATHGASGTDVQLGASKPWYTCVNGLLLHI